MYRECIIRTYPFGKVTGNSGELGGVGTGNGIMSGKEGHLQVTTTHHYT